MPVLPVPSVRMVSHSSIFCSCSKKSGAAALAPRGDARSGRGTPLAEGDVPLSGATAGGSQDEGPALPASGIVRGHPAKRAGC